MGEVYKAVDPTLGRTVAVKIVRTDSHDSKYLQRLLREAQAYGRLKHSNIVTVYEAREADGLLYIAMEYLDGSSLSAAMDQGQLSFGAKISVLVQILGALQYAHSQGIVHRDIKPSNVHLLTDGSVKLLDFGLARVMRAQTLTATDTVLGTPHYASPEQLKGEDIDGRTDVYSTGVLAYEMFTHRRPFDGNSIGTIVAKVLSEPAPPLETEWSRTFPEIERIVHRAMAKSVQDRFATAEDMKNALTAFLGSSDAAIRTTQEALAVRERHSVSEAKTLLQTRRQEEALALLEQTVRLNPEAREARTLLVAATADPQPDSKPVPKEAPSPPPAGPPSATAQLPPLAKPPSSPPPALATPRAAPALPPPKPPMPEPADTRSRGRLVSWLGAASVLVALGIFAAVLGARWIRSATTTEPPKSSAPAGAVVPPAAVDTRPDSAPAVATPGRTAAGGQGPAAPPASGPPSRPGSAGRVAGGGRSQATVDARSVYIDARATDAALNTELVNALTARGMKTVTSAARARLEISVRIQVSTRPAPVGGTSALTADYTATMQMRDTVTGTRQTRSFDGHALDFGEPVVRQAAYRRAAEQLAEAIDSAVRE
jgi:serine/threonine protein kinase